MSDGATDMPVDLDRAALVITPKQAAALAALLDSGKHTGTTLPDCDPPSRVALVAVGGLEPAFEDWSKPWESGEIPAPDVAIPPGHTLGVLSDDGGTWQIVRAGICWPARSDDAE